MKKPISLALLFFTLLLTACGVSQVDEPRTQCAALSVTQNGNDSIQGTDADTQKLSTVQVKDYPKIEELSWEFRNSVKYGEPAAVFDYTNNSNYTIVLLDFQFRMKENITSEQLQLVDIFTHKLVPDDEISGMKPYVYDWIVCDPGEKAEGADCYMKYNTHPANTDQCELMELKSADIYFIGEDGRKHTVSYSAENGGYSLWPSSEELFTWIDNDYTKMIPKPDTRIASADQFRENCLGVKAYDMTHDAYLAYVDACEQIGFENKYPDEDHDYSYTGTNQEGCKIHIRYIDSMHYVEITLERTGG